MTVEQEKMTVISFLIHQICRDAEDMKIL